MTLDGESIALLTGSQMSLGQIDSGIVDGPINNLIEFSIALNTGDLNLVLQSKVALVDNTELRQLVGTARLPQNLLARSRRCTPPTACIWSRRCGSSAEKGTSMEILIITGLSGGGKSRAASYLEDIGYYTVDNLPAEMMVKFADFCAGSSGRYDRVALVYDVRSGEPTDILIETLERLKASGVNCRMLFLEADDQTIVNRYKETRRMHPLQKKGESVEQAIRREREWMQPVRDHADFVLDTSALSIAKLRSELLDLFGQQGDRGGLAVNILSFGFKHGIPIEADLVFDVRFMPNPYYVPELKNKTGLDQAVRDFVFSFRQTNDFMEQLEKMLTFLLPLYAEEGKSALVIAIGCTGGHHRSVAVAHELAEYITEEGYQVTENHRDISR